MNVEIKNFDWVKIKTTHWYKNCKRQRKNGALCCGSCPWISIITKLESGDKDVLYICPSVVECKLLLKNDKEQYCYKVCHHNKPHVQTEYGKKSAYFCNEVCEMAKRKKLPYKCVRAESVVVKEV